RQRRLDLHRAHPLPRDFQHVVGAARVPKVAIGILVVLVAGTDPVAFDGLLGLLVFVPVVGAGAVAADDQAAGLAYADRLIVLVEDFGFVSGDHLPARS